MDTIQLAKQVETKYQRYLKTTFYFRDPDFRASFEEALSSGHLSKGPYLEATPVFKRTQKPRDFFPGLLGCQIDEALLKAVQGDERRLYLHQEEAIRRVSQGHNVIVATGTGSGKTEAFLYPVLLHLYQEFQAGDLCPGVRALILYPMNALANDQRDRLAAPPTPSTDPGILWTLSELKSPFRFTFGQYIGETPKDEQDSSRHARDHLASRLPGELVLRSEMRKTPPHILLTNYSMLEYLLLRPDDSPLFDKGQAAWWTFLVLDEAHQYRGSRGIEMAMLVRRLKQRLAEGGCSAPLRCIATSATLAGGKEDKKAVAEFASDLFGEHFREEDVILGETEPVPEPGPKSLSRYDYRILDAVIRQESAEAKSHLAEMADKLGVSLEVTKDLPKTVGSLLQRDSRTSSLRNLITGNPREIQEIADQIFSELPSEERVPELSKFVELLLQARDPISNSPLLSARYHLFVRSLEGAFVSYWPQKKVRFERKAIDGEGIAFEVALCRECGQHYFVAQKGFKNGKLAEAIRDPSHDNFGATFLRPIENGADDDEEDENSEGGRKQAFQLCVRCGEMARGEPQCGHDNSIQVIKEEAPKGKDRREDEDRADQMAKCGACGYNASGHDPVREVVYGTDGPHAVIATTLYQNLPEKRKKVLAFADGRQEAAFFAWYLEDSYKHILRRNLVLKVVQELSAHATEGLSLRELATSLRDVFRKRNVFPPAIGELELRREAWLGLYGEFLTDEPRISLEGVGLIRWSVKWPNWFEIPEALGNPPWSLTKTEASNLLFLLLDSMRTDRAIDLRTEKGVSLSWSDLGLQATQKHFRIGPPKGRKDVTSWDGKSGKRSRLLAKLLRDGHSEQAALELAVTALRVIWETFRQSDENAPSSHDRVLVPIDDAARRLNPDWWRVHLITDEDVIFQCDTCGRLQTVSARSFQLRPTSRTGRAPKRSLRFCHHLLPS